MKADELRDMYLKFFEGKGHTVIQGGAMGQVADAFSVLVGYNQQVNIGFGVVVAPRPGAEEHHPLHSVTTLGLQLLQETGQALPFPVGQIWNALFREHSIRSRFALLHVSPGRLSPRHSLPD